MITELRGVVTKYKGNGRKLHYPTANLSVQTDARDGVYFGFADMGNYHKHPALIFVGVPTTVGDTTRRVEAHLLDIPDEDYYGLELILQLHKFHRTNQTFDTIDELVKVMQADEAASRTWFASLQSTPN